MVQIYKSSGFEVTSALMDGKYSNLHREIVDMGVLLNSSSCDEHMGDIEQYIHPIKECMQALHNMLPFKIFLLV